MGRDLEVTVETARFPAALRPGLIALAVDMAAHGTQRSDPTRAVMAMMGDRWTALILQVLMIGTWRHADLRRALSQLSAEQAISQRVLTLKLRALERDGFVERHVTADVPPRVSYALTPLGHDLAGQVRALIDWVNARGPAIAAARAAFDTRDED
ncbi:MULTISPECIES: winged helix-turn-helix transcriptional regulator [unclassified Sphingomonas]|uniref:winged helix-turn-helix transcriptional regulator n=1 Tax=Novosphingobium rhizosphaerae TaxID=1551649 RepID=UPI0015CD6EAA